LPLIMLLLLLLSLLLLLLLLLGSATKAALANTSAAGLFRADRAQRCRRPRGTCLKKLAGSQRACVLVRKASSAALPRTYLAVLGPLWVPDRESCFLTGMGISTPPAPMAVAVAVAEKEEEEEEEEEEEGEEEEEEAMGNRTGTTQACRRNTASSSACPPSITVEPSRRQDRIPRASRSMGGSMAYAGASGTKGTPPSAPPAGLIPTLPALWLVAGEPKVAAAQPSKPAQMRPVCARIPAFQALSPTSCTSCRSTERSQGPCQ
jgi:hypothetical protein